MTCEPYKIIGSIVMQVLPISDNDGIMFWSNQSIVDTICFLENFVESVKSDVKCPHVTEQRKLSVYIHSDKQRFGAFRAVR